jgi:aspartate carbamoyltransferase catalytic subunit
VLYVTRIQKERFQDISEYEAVLGSYVVNAELMRSAKEKMMGMHPLPRLGEIAVEVDADPRCAYFEQMENGVFMRMAILNRVLG